MYECSYSPKTVEQSRTIYRILAGQGRAAQKKLITYKELAELAGVSHHRALRFPLGKIQAECRIANRPTITVLVVRAGVGLPGGGCDASEAREFVETLDKVAATPWPAAPWW